MIDLTYKILNNEDKETMLLESIKSMFGNEIVMEALTEAIDLDYNLSSYRPLVEAAIDISKNIKDINKTMKDDNNESSNVFTKIFSSFKNMLDWWYKVDPEKKFKTLHVILHVAISIIEFVAPSIVLRNITARKLVKFILSAVLAAFFALIKKLNDSIEYKINSKDIDKNIKEYDRTIDVFNKEIDKCKDEAVKASLEKNKLLVEQSLKELTVMKEKRG